VESPTNGAPTNGAATEPIERGFIRIGFYDDGNMSLHGEGVGPPQYWAAAHALELWGDSEFAMQQVRESQKTSPLVVPADHKGRGGIRRIGS
jgi:hypothetical protein